MTTKENNLSVVKHVITDADIYRLSYTAVKSKDKTNGICAICECFDKKSCNSNDDLKLKSVIERRVYLKSVNDRDIISIIEKLSDHLVFPDDVEDIIEEYFLLR